MKDYLQGVGAALLGLLIYAVLALASVGGWAIIDGFLTR